jgi:hypothetical protein
MAGKRAPIIPTGTRFGRYVVLGLAESKNRHPYYQVKCDCGTERDVSRSRLLDGSSTSCGCARDEASSKNWTIHGGSRTLTYSIWKGIIARCFNESNRGYKHYGGRGITMCDRWRNSFVEFLNDMGEKPQGFTIERINVNGNYCKENCKWASYLEQGRNRRNNKKYTFMGKNVTVQEAIDMAGVNIRRVSVNQRLKNGMTIEEAVMTPPDPKKQRAGWEAHKWAVKQ